MVLPKRITKIQGLILLVVVGLIVGAMSYWLIPSLFPTDESALLGNTSLTPKFVSVNFKLDILDDSRFTALSSIAHEITPRVGRKNPFILPTPEPATNSSVFR